MTNGYFAKASNRFDRVATTGENKQLLAAQAAQTNLFYLFCLPFRQ
jgi:hypothetical protein